ncbi:MAG: NPCBM/NEW2 domain-containing protein [Dongiaceae bacterium]
MFAGLALAWQSERAFNGQASAADKAVFPLKVSANGRYLVDQPGRPFFIHGDSPWSAIAQLRLAGESGATATNTWDYYLTNRPRRAAGGLRERSAMALRHQRLRSSRTRYEQRQQASDGRAITLDGRTYVKRLGVHFPSEIRYQLSGRYKTFTAGIGVDDEAGNKGVMTFEVWGDGIKLFDSGLMRGMSKTKIVDVSVAGVNELRLVTTEGGNHEGAVTFQVWGDGARLYESGLTDGSMPAQPIKVRVAGVNNLRLIVTDGDGNNLCAHADWADARLISQNN